jgi:hypothetical protein
MSRRWLSLLLLVPASATADGPFPLREFRGSPAPATKDAIYSHINECAFSKDGSKIAYGSGSTVFVASLSDGKEIARTQLPDRQIYHRLAFSADGKRVVWTGREDPLIRVFDAATGKQLREFVHPTTDNREKQFSSHFLCFSADGSKMAFNGARFFTGLDIMDVASGKIVVSIKDVNDARGCSFFPGGKRIATHSGDGEVDVWDATTGKLVRRLRGKRDRGGAYAFLVYSPDGKSLATGGHVFPGLDVWSVETGKLICTVPAKAYFYHAAFSADGQTVACLQAEGRPYLYHLVAEKETHAFNPPERLSTFTRFSPDGRYVAFTGPATDVPEDARQSSVFVYEIPSKVFAPAAARVDDATWDQLWADLMTANDLRLQKIRNTFRDAPKEAVEQFRKRLPAYPADVQVKVEKWIDDLDADDFRTRDAAGAELQKLAHEFAPLLTARRDKAGPGEVRNRLTFVLKTASVEPIAPALVRESRVVELAAEMKAPEAIAYLKELAAGASGARRTVEAKAALERAARK